MDSYQAGLILISNVLNFLAIIIGLVIAILGIISTAVSRGDPGAVIKEFGRLIEDETDLDLSAFGSIGISVIVLGLFVILVSLLGMCVTVSDSKGPHHSFAEVIFLFVIAFLTIGVVALVKHEQLKNELKDAASTSLGKAENGSDVYKVWEDVQKKARCCGVSCPQDWGMQLPDSCCHTYNSAGCNVNGSWSVGCYTKVYDTVQPHLLGIGISSIIFCVIGIMQITSACLLARFVADYSHQCEELIREFERTLRSRISEGDAEFVEECLQGFRRGFQSGIQSGASREQYENLKEFLTGVQRFMGSVETTGF